MISITLCMIVKNEEKILGRCLSCLWDFMDEIVIVDTGSTDKTKEIAAKYTDKIYDFQWVDDFAAARNFAFSKATGDYIYSADADETLDEINRERFRLLKENLLPEIEIVQMYYCNQLKFGTVYNYDKEYRPKLFKRVRTFTWIDPIHETVRTEPVVFDSDIEIRHEQEESHAKRDLAAFERLCGTKGHLSERLLDLYARELFIAGMGGFSGVGSGNRWISVRCLFCMMIWRFLRTVSFITNPAEGVRSGAVTVFLPLTGVCGCGIWGR